MDRPKARILGVGLDPAVVDYSLAPVPGLNAEKLVAALNAEHDKLTRLGYDMTMLFVDDGKTAEAVLAQALTQDSYDCILIGAGLRLIPRYFLLFEKLVNIVHQCAPASAKVCFNTSPSDSAEAVQRWV